MLGLENGRWATEPCPLDGAAAAHEVSDEHDQADYQQDVDQSAADVKGECAERPEDR